MDQSYYTYNLLDLDAGQKEVIPIPDRTLVKFNGKLFFFIKGNIVHSKYGFDFLGKGSVKTFYPSIQDDLLYAETIEKVIQLCPDIGGDDRTYITFDLSGGIASQADEK